jgi:septal ring factor EnvC (AmiA/AmiB activator)
MEFDADLYEMSERYNRLYSQLIYMRRDPDVNDWEINDMEEELQQLEEEIEIREEQDAVL